NKLSYNNIEQMKEEYGNKINALVVDMWAAQNIGGQSAQGFNAETENDLKEFLGKHGSSEWAAALDTDLR
ncbi:MAG TPA: hypothetical protein VKA95_05395, partial [Nitrososphaeraceae archaeon]|nr:hypothetical protein [Nitrososphaeraceae archaeon]